MKKPRVLVVDDDPTIVSLVRLYLEHGGFEVAVAYNGTQAIEEHDRERPDLVVLDVMLPRLGGVEVCRRLRARSAVPIIMLTVRAGVDDTLAGLEAGADDYVTKPFSPRELVARIRTVLRRAATGGEAAEVPVTHGALRLDPTRRDARVSGRPLALTPREFALLEAFARAPGRAFTREQLLERAFEGETEARERTVDAHVKNLRRKLGRKVRIETVFGVGYRLADDA